MAVYAGENAIREYYVVHEIQTMKREMRELLCAGTLSPEYGDLAL